jgi:peptidyl-prolyl cis-trans isomerase B (cyclophilin B)
MKYIVSIFLLLWAIHGYSAEAPTVKIETNVGTIVIELNAEKAPKTVANFLRYVNDGLYNGTIFHRVIPTFMIQGGGFTQDFKPKDTHAPIKNEANNGLKNVRGTIAMARTNAPHSATSQFFINVVDNPFLDHTAPNPKGWGYTVFGQVIEGMEVVDKIRKVQTGSGGRFWRDVPQETMLIKTVSVVSEEPEEQVTSESKKPEPTESAEPVTPKESEPTEGTKVPE